MTDVHILLLRSLTQLVHPERAVVFSDQAELAQAILDADRNVRVDVIGAIPPGGWPENTRARSRAYDEPSLDALPKVHASPSLVVLDRDPNWYSVITMLRHFVPAEVGVPFPLVLVRDAGWPHGRRDAYPRVEAVPEAERRTHARSGVLPGAANLDDRGLFADVDHATSEGGARNGVRTAVDDFCAETALELTRHFVVPFHGAELIVDRRALEDDALRTYLGELEPSSAVTAILEALERDRVRAEVELLARRREVTQLSARHESVRADYKALRQRMESEDQELRGLRDRISDGVTHERKLEARIAELEAGRAVLEGFVSRLEKDLVDADRTKSALRLATQQLDAAAERERQLQERLLLAQRKAREAEAERATLTALKAENARLSERAAVLSEELHGGAPQPRRKSAAVPSKSPTTARDVSRFEKRLAKLRRDPRRFLADSRYGVIRSLGDILF